MKLLLKKLYRLQKLGRLQHGRRWIDFYTWQWTQRQKSTQKTCVGNCPDLRYQDPSICFQSISAKKIKNKKINNCHTLRFIYIWKRSQKELTCSASSTSLHSLRASSYTYSSSSRGRAVAATSMDLEGRSEWSSIVTS